MSTTERDFYKAIVYINGVKNPNLHCLNIELSSGVSPGKARFMQTFGRDVSGPVTIYPPTEAGYDSVKYWQRVSVFPSTNGQEGTTAIFNGWIMRRSDQGVSDKVIWTAYDGMIVMQNIAVRGCIMYDPEAKEARYVARNNTVFNPGGYWNCTGFEFTINGVTNTYPIFIRGRKVQAYESPDTDFGITDLTTGKASPWTPKRALLYLQLVAYLNSASPIPAGMPTTIQTSLSPDYDFMMIKYSDINNMIGYDPGSESGGPNIDPLNRKLQTTSVQGQTLLTAFNAVLRAAGTHTYTIANLPDTPGTQDKFKSKLTFPLIGYAPQGSGYGIYIQRGGVAGDEGLSTPPNAYDFHFDEDASEIIESVLVEGDVVRNESRLTFTRPADNVEYADDTNSEIIPAWTRAQETAYLYCIHGGPPASSNEQFAYRAKITNDPTTLEVCDGTNGKPIIWAHSTEAKNAADESFPSVFRAWRLNGRSSSVQLALSAGLTFGGMQDARPILSEQLQYAVKDLGGGEDRSNWLLVNIPIRAEVYSDDIAGWVPVPNGISIRNTPDGTIWLDSLGPSADGSIYTCYNRSIDDFDAYDASKIKLKTKIRINAAFPCDARVIGYKAASPAGTAGTALTRNEYLDPTYRRCFIGAGVNRYMDSGNAYRWHKQRDSYPTINPTYYGGVDGDEETDMPLDRDVPPGNESINAEYEAQRILARYVNPRRQATFSMIGIQPVWNPADRIDYVVLLYPDGSNKYYYLRGCIGTVLHDFIAQQTTLGGLMGDYGNPTTGGI